MSSNMILALAFGIGIVAGLRALTPLAVVSWAAHLHWINLEGTHLSFMSSTVAVVIFTLLALVELVNDKLPKTPPRTAAPGLITRIVTGGFTAATLSIGAGESFWLGAVLGVIGALVGTFAGYQVRKNTVKALHSPDFVIALLEDAVAICAGLFLVSRL
jgi:uncharacterized membrane protein